MRVLLELDLAVTLRPSEIEELEERAAQSGILLEEIIAEDIRRGIELSRRQPSLKPAKRSKPRTA